MEQVEVTKITKTPTGEERRNMTIGKDTWDYLQKNPPLNINDNYVLRAKRAESPAKELITDKKAVNKDEAKATNVVDDSQNGVATPVVGLTKDCSNAATACELIDTFTKQEEVNASIVGDGRKGVLKYATEKIKTIVNA